MESRQVGRRRQFLAEKHKDRPGPRPSPFGFDPPKPAVINKHHIATWIVGRTEFMFHATKGLRSRYLGR